jgi:NAD(P)-dependent dehydrogenase (short-subunit alcohol dehydrogenase family)
MIIPLFLGETIMDNNEGVKTAIVTGGTGAIGGAIARGIALKGYNLVIIARDELKAQRRVNEIQRDTGNLNVRYEISDISRRNHVFSLAERWDDPLHVLVNNAAVTPRTHQVTPEGIELQFATNVLGYFWMTQAFKSFLSTTTGSRIVDVASYWAGGLDLNDLEFKRRHYTNGAAYRQSKQANRMLVVAWSEYFREDGITINACHPGDVNSTLSNNLGFGGSQSPNKGAETPVWLATTPAGFQENGKYFENKRINRCQFGENLEAVRRLFEICQSYNQ